MDRRPTRPVHLTGLLAACVLSVGPASAQELPLPATRPPVVLVHGIWDSGRDFDPLVARLTAAGTTHVHALDLVPNDGALGLVMLANQLEDAVTRLQAESGSPVIDLVGFSMGSLVARWWLQKLGGKARTRRFIAISGPQHGTAAAWFNHTPGGRDMRPGSPFLRALLDEPDPFGAVQVSSYWTPMDLIIVPSWSSAIEGSRKRRFWVPLHPMMVSDPAVIQAVVDEFGRP